MYVYKKSGCKRFAVGDLRKVRGGLLDFAALALEDLVTGGVAVGVGVIEIADDFFSAGTTNDEVVAAAFAAAVDVIRGDIAVFHAVVGAVQPFVLTNRRFSQLEFFMLGIFADFAGANVLGEVNDVVHLASFCAL